MSDRDLIAILAAVIYGLGRETGLQDAADRAKLLLEYLKDG